MKTIGETMETPSFRLDGESGLADELLEKHGLQPQGIRASILRRLTLLGKPQ